MTTTTVQLSTSLSGLQVLSTLKMADGSALDLSRGLGTLPSASTAEMGRREALTKLMPNPGEAMPLYKSFCGPSQSVAAG